MNTEEMLRKIASVNQVHPCFVDFIRSFRIKKTIKDEDAFGGYVSRVWSEASGLPGYEFFYNLRYVEETGRDSHPWSLRRMGVYQKYSAEAKTSVWIFVQATSIAKKLAKISAEARDPLHLAFHVSLLSSTMGKWTGYLKSLDRKIREKAENTRFFKSENIQTQTANPPVTFSDIQRLEFLQESIQDVIMILEENLKILEGIRALSKSSKYRGMMTSAGPSEMTMQMEEELEICVSRFTMHRGWAEMLLSRIRSTCVLTTALLGYRNDVSIHQNTENMAMIAKATENDSRTMLRLAEAAARDSITVRLITVITVIYLPGTFMATLFSTNFVNQASQDTSGPSSTSHQALIYATITAALTLVTVSVAYFWDSREKQKRSSVLFNPTTRP